jgi:hypothetical protein
MCNSVEPTQLLPYRNVQYRRRKLSTWKNYPYKLKYIHLYENYRSVHKLLYHWSSWEKNLNNKEQEKWRSSISLPDHETHLLSDDTWCISIIDVWFIIGANVIQQKKLCILFMAGQAFTFPHSKGCVVSASLVWHT